MAEIKVLGGTNQSGVNLYTGEKGVRGQMDWSLARREMAALLMSNQFHHDEGPDPEQAVDDTDYMLCLASHCQEFTFYPN